ncbi:MAG: C1 family peptidase [Bacteroidetes bacterium]|nr:C1 family peptidase [Bacteroidota bacterium]
MSTPETPRTFDARPDSADFRDRLYVPSLIEVRPEIRLAAYQSYEIPVLDQGKEGACTGFALATIAHYLLRRRIGEKAVPLTTDQHVSPHMLYEMAKRYDEWPGDEYEGSSARGAMKAWHKHGACQSKLWAGPTQGQPYNRRLTADRATDAATRPLGAYYRVNHKDLVAMHSALTEVGILYATAGVHQGWTTPTSDGTITYNEHKQELGGHAFAIVAYDAEGFWIQNSWGEDWGVEGFGRVSYDDWLLHGTDVWVARLGAPVALHRPDAAAISASAVARKPAVYAYHILRPHIISIGNEGRLSPNGTYGTDAEDVCERFATEIPKAMKDWKRKRLLLYAHGGLVPEKAAVQRVADYREAFLTKEVFPLAFVWKTDFWTTLQNMLQDAFRRRRAEGFLDSAKDFMLDRLDDALEPLARSLTGKASWDEMKENALAASKRRYGKDGGALLALNQILDPNQENAGFYDDVEIHIVGHSAGSIFMAPVVQHLADAGRTIASCTLWAPACTMDLFRKMYVPAIESGHIDRFTLFTLTDKAEQDDHCAHIYNKSLLYLVSHAFEKRPRIPLFRDGEPILGMAKWIQDAIKEDERIEALFKQKSVQWVQAPNHFKEGSPSASRANSHGGFDDDAYTLKATLARVLAQGEARGNFVLQRSSGGLRDQRHQLDLAHAPQLM